MSFISHTGQAEGALPNGTRVRKINSKPDDTHRDGALATILGSLAVPESSHIGYFVEWDDLPGVPVAIADFRVEEVRREAEAGGSVPPP
jgi:hypothetical protein